MPSIIFDEREIISKQTITPSQANANTGYAYVGRSTAELIRTGKAKAILILIEE